MSHRIQPGQTYRSLSNRHHPCDEPRRIRIVGQPGSTPGGGQPFGKVRIATLAPDGREIRRRFIDVDQLHASPTTADGRPRRTGYALEQPCSTPHHQHPETVCTEPAGHYRRITDPHAGPLIIDGQECGGAAWDDPEEQP